MKLKIISILLLAVLLFGCIDLGLKEGTKCDFENSTLRINDGPKMVCMNGVWVNESIAKQKPAVAKTTPASSVDCGKDMVCFIEKSKTCSKASIQFNYDLSLLGMVETVSQHLEINGQDGAKCTLYLRYDNLSVAFSEQLVQQMLSAGATSEQIAAQEKLSQESVKPLINKEGTCKFDASELSGMLGRWKAGKFSSGFSNGKAIGDFENGSCTGSMFDLVVSGGTSQSTGSSSGSSTSGESATKCSGTSYATSNGKTTVCVNGKMTETCTKEGEVYYESEFMEKQIVCENGKWVSKKYTKSEASEETQPSQVSQKEIAMPTGTCVPKVTMTLYRYSGVSQSRICNKEDVGVTVSYRICETEMSCAKLLASDYVGPNSCKDQRGTKNYVNAAIDNVTIKDIAFYPAKVC